MNYEKKYLKYKNKYHSFKDELEQKGIDVDQLLQQYLNNDQSGGGNMQSEMNLTDTPNNIKNLEVEENNQASEQKQVIEQTNDTQNQNNGVFTGGQSNRRKARALARASAAAAPVAPIQSSTPVTTPLFTPANTPANTTNTTHNTTHIHTYNDPLYPTISVPAYSPIISTNPLYTVPTNTFPIYRVEDRLRTLDLDESLSLDERPRRRTSRRRTSKRRTSKRRTSKRRTSKRRTSKRRSSKRRTSKRRSSKRKSSKRKSRR